MKEPVNDWERQLAGKPPVNNGFTSDLEQKVRERIRMRQQKKSSAFRAVAALTSIVVILGIGWLFRDDLLSLLNPADKPQDALAQLLNDPLGDKEVELTVQTMTGYNIGGFKKPFIIRHPSVTINQLGLEGDTLYEPDKFKAFIEQSGREIDVFMLPLKQFAILAGEGKLKSLDTLFKESGINPDAYNPRLVELIRLAGGGELYGFTQGFTSTTLFVNRELFAEHGIPLPEDGDSLDEILDTAARFKGTGVYGIATSGGFSNEGIAQFAAFIGQSNGLKTLAIENNRLTASLDSKGWKGVWRQVADGYKDGWLGETPPINWDAGTVTETQVYERDLFMSGKAAMVIGDEEYYRGVSIYGAKGGASLDWVTIPYKFDPAATNQYDYLGSGYVYAINANTRNPEAAWELLRFIVGEEMAVKNNREIANNLFSILAANPSSMKSQPEEKWRGFYNMEADPARVLSESKEAAGKYYGVARYEFLKLSKEQLSAVLQDKKSVDDALSDLQAKLEEFLAGYGEWSGN